MPAYACLVLDHDDTAVNSTPEIGYPSFTETLRAIRPDVRMTRSEFQRACFDPGFHALCRDVLHFSDAEMEEEGRAWNAYVSAHMPAFFPGMPELVRRYTAAGGTLCVVSHSYSETIRRDYLAQCGVAPELVFGWELPKQQRKPSAYPLNEIMRRLSFKPSEILVVDDLATGLEMARSADTDFACAGWVWAHELPEAAARMRAQSSMYLERVGDLARLLFPEQVEK